MLCNKMVKVFQGTDKEFYMDGFLQENLDMAKKIIKKDWDMVFLVDGYEGAGKSVLAQQMAYYCDPTLNLNRIVFNPNDFMKAVTEAEKYQAVVYDEAYGGLNNKSVLSTVNKSIVQMMTVIRDKNLFIYIVLPTFFDLGKYIALWRSRALISVYTDKFERGYFKFYNIERKKDLYVKGKQFYNYHIVKPNFRGRFVNGYVVDEEEYKKKKRETSLSVEAEEKKSLNVKRDMMIRRMHTVGGLTHKDIAELIGMSPRGVGKIVNKVNKVYEQMNKE